MLLGFPKIMLTYLLNFDNPLLVQFVVPSIIHDVCLPLNTVVQVLSLPPKGIGKETRRWLGVDCHSCSVRSERYQVMSFLTVWTSE
jgi:hypothetical protein